MCFDKANKRILEIECIKLDLVGVHKSAQVLKTYQRQGAVRLASRRKRSHLGKHWIRLRNVIFPRFYFYLLARRSPYLSTYLPTYLPTSLPTYITTCQILSVLGVVARHPW